MRSYRLITFFTALAVVLSACAAKPTRLAPTPTELKVAATAVVATRTPLPTQTSRPTLTPTITETLPPTPTFTVTPDPALSKIKLIGLAWYSNYDMLLSFEFPGKVNPALYRVTLEDKEYRCETIAKFENRLYCRGQGAKVLAEAIVRVYQVGSAKPGFEKKVWIPFFDNNYNSPDQ
jgi:hypothetical protein